MKKKRTILFFIIFLLIPLISFAQIEKRDDYIALKNNIQQAVKESRAVIILNETHVDKAGFYLKNFR